MKKFLITAFTLLISLGVMAQAANDHTLRLYYGGEVIFSRLLSQLDSINFKVNTVEEDKPVVPDISTCDKKYSQEGFYLGIIGFNEKLTEREIGLLNPNTINSYKTFVNNLTKTRSTVLYWAEENSLDRLTSAAFPSNLISASVVTFTDGLDQGSNAWRPIKFPSQAEYLEYLNNRILSDVVCGSNIKIDAYAIGLKGNDVQDVETFNNNLKKLSSGEDKMFEASDMDEVNEKFNNIARSLYSATSTFVMTFTIAEPFENEIRRFTFDNVENGEDSKCYIEGTFKGGNLTNIKYEGCLYEGPSVVNGVRSGYVDWSFSFEGISDINKEQLPKTHILNFYKSSEDVLWQKNTEFNNKEDVEVEEVQRTAVVMLVLDCSSSLGEDFVKMQSAANNFISLLLNASEQNNTVSFNANGGTGTMSDMTYEKGQTKALIANKFTRAGYIFKGWNTKSDGTGTQYTDKQSLTPTENITLYAQWEEIPTVTISFIANGGSGSMQSVSVVKGASTYLPDVTFTRAGYKFIGWNTNADGSGFGYQNKQNVATYNNLILYAQWKEDNTIGTTNGYDWVDLGLPSGILWATCNVGADSPEHYGSYFAWGETTTKSIYDWSTYKWCNDSYYTMTKYCTSSSYGTVDNKTNLDFSDDAANANWGGSWQMPTKEEMEELINNCIWSWTTQRGVNGYKVTSKTNGNSIFLPAAGFSSTGSIHNKGTYGGYYSNQLQISDSANGLFFFEDRIVMDVAPRRLGYSIRPVLH